MKALEDAAETPRLVDQRPQLRAGELGPRREPQNGALDALLDQVILERPLVLQVDRPAPALGLIERRLRDVEVPPIDQLGICRKKNVSSRVRMWEPSTSASVMMMMRW